MNTLPTFYLMFSLVLLSLQFTGCAIHKAYQKDAARVGEVAPCSARVAKKITEPIVKNHSPKRIIEVGAGSGALTNKILEKMTDLDHLDLIEIEPLLCDVLREKFGALKNVSIQCMDFLEWKPSAQYDYVVSTLPFNSFSPDLVQRLVDHLIEISKDGAYLGFVEYKWLSSFKLIGLPKKEKATFQKTREIIKNFRNKYGYYATDVYINFPPLIIYHLKIDKKSSSTPLPVK
jgi:phosphatidylethanolamine/phosphatidyl-N-methylethanolamine N-methyltransferase